MKPGGRNLLTDVDGLRVGNVDDVKLRSGVTAIVCDAPATASCHVMGAAPGTRETDLLAPENTVETVNGIILTGGSAFGLDAAGGAQSALKEEGLGLRLQDHIIPIVPAAVIFDLPNGGDKDWGKYSPYRELGYKAVRNASAEFTIGSAGAGFGAITAGLKGGLGSASIQLESGFTIAALIAVNTVGSVTIGQTPHFWAAPFEIGAEYGGMGLPHPLPPDATDLVLKFHGRSDPGANTAIGVIATDARLTKAQLKRLAMSAHDGIARAVWPSHSIYDGDTIFTLATGTAGRSPSAAELLEINAWASATTARAIARGVHEAATAIQGEIYPAWRDKFG